jgi:uracil-DNA glycosylase
MMIIGQAPGVTEVEAGRPFNASSGSRLFNWLTGAGMEETQFRTQEYMTSVTKCFPGKAKGGSGDRVPTREEQDLCRPFLDGEIQLVDPRLILPVGRLAINLFFPPKSPLTEIIGSVVRVDNRTIVPLPHPSGASRWHQIPENRERIDMAIAKIAEVSRSLGL